MKPVIQCSFGRGSNQRGLSLVTTLLFMVAALVLGVSVMGVNVMQERMLGNAKDRDLAFQVAEAALRDAELDIAMNITAGSAFSPVCAAGLCIPPTQRAVVSPLPVHQQAGFSWAPADGMVRRYGQFTALPPILGVISPPVYVVENLGVLGLVPGDGGLDLLGTPRAAFRITARAYGARAETVVMLQSIFFRQ